MMKKQFELADPFYLTFAISMLSVSSLAFLYGITVKEDPPLITDFQYYKFFVITMIGVIYELIDVALDVILLITMDYYDYP